MKTLNSRIAECLQTYSRKTFLVEPATGETLTFAEFEMAMAGAQRLLWQHGVTEGDVVSLIADNSIDLVVMLYAVLLCGGIAKPLNPQLTTTELENLLQHSCSSLIVADRRVDISGFTGSVISISDYRQIGRGLTLKPHPVKEDDPALLIYTSGTTSQPKGVLLSHRNIVHNTLTAIDWFRLSSEHTKVCILPLFHMFGFISDLSTMALCGGTTVILDSFDISKLGSIEAAIHKYPVNSFSAVPLAFELFLRLRCDLAGKHMQFCVSGAAPLRETTASAFAERYKFPILPAYGLTETTCFAAISPPDKIRKGSAGLPAAVSIRVTRPDGSEAEAHEIGELLMRGESVMRQGYFKHPVQAFMDGWFRSGDLGYLDEDGYVHVTGRKKNMVIRGGEKIYLEDVDACLAGMTGIADSATIRFEEEGTEKIAAFIVRRDNVEVSAPQVTQFLLQKLGYLRIPDLVVFSAHIPRTPTNKVKLRELQERLGRAVPQSQEPEAVLNR
jgi:acyl-CoA synthetase (AMP-forming)/AMP-acid ligase II